MCKLLHAYIFSYSYILGFILWNIDNRLCPHLRYALLDLLLDGQEY